MQHKDERSWMLHNVLAAANLPPVSTAYNVDETSNTYALIKELAIPKSMRFLINAYVFDISSTLYTLIKEQPLIKCEHSTSCLYNQWRSAYTL